MIDVYWSSPQIIRRFYSQSSWAGLQPSCCSNAIASRLEWLLARADTFVHENGGGGTDQAIFLWAFYSHTSTLHCVLSPYVVSRPRRVLLTMIRESVHFTTIRNHKVITLKRRFDQTPSKFGRAWPRELCRELWNLEWAGRCAMCCTKVRRFSFHLSLVDGRLPTCLFNGNITTSSSLGKSGKGWDVYFSPLKRSGTSPAKNVVGEGKFARSRTVCSNQNQRGFLLRVAPVHANFGARRRLFHDSYASSRWLDLQSSTDISRLSHKVPLI